MSAKHGKATSANLLIVGDDDIDENRSSLEQESPSSSQFRLKIKSKNPDRDANGPKDRKKSSAVGGALRESQNSMLQSAQSGPEETLDEALIDLYLSVKIRSNDEIDNYNEEMLAKERQKLRDTDPFTVLEYIKTSIEILMNMKMEEHQAEAEKNKKKGKKASSKKESSATKAAADPTGKELPSDSESIVSMDEPPSDYEQMLQKYEAEVRNHIKIEQQLKLHIECVQDKLEDQEKVLKKLDKEKSSKQNDKELELIRYKDLLSIREKDNEKLKNAADIGKRAEENYKRKITELENEKNELNQTLVKAQRGAQLYKPQSRSQFQVTDEFQEAGVLPTGPNDHTGDDLRQNYNQYIAGSRTHKNGSVAGKQHSTSGAPTGSNSHSLTNQTMYLYKSHGSTERVNSSQNASKQIQMVDTKFKKEFLKQKQQNGSNRDFGNRSALGNAPTSDQTQQNAITLPFGKSPDRSKNKSVYSHGPSTSQGSVSNNNGSKGAQLVGPTKSPYLGTQQNFVSQAAKHSGKRGSAIDEVMGSTVGSKGSSKDRLNQQFKTQIVGHNHSTSQSSASQALKVSNASSQQVHARTKSQNAAQLSLKLQSASTYQKKINENNQLIKNLNGQPQASQQSNSNVTGQMASTSAAMSSQASQNTQLQSHATANQMHLQTEDTRRLISENSFDHMHPHNKSYGNAISYGQGTFVDMNGISQPLPQAQFTSHTMDSRAPQQQVPLMAHQQHQPGGAQQLIPQTHNMHMQQIPAANIISGTYINSNIIVHHQKAKSTSGIPNKKSSQKQSLASQQRHTMNQTATGLYGSTNHSLGLQGPTDKTVLQVGSAAVGAGLIVGNPASVSGNKILGKKNSTASSHTTKLLSGTNPAQHHMRAGSFNIDRSFQSQNHLSSQKAPGSQQQTRAASNNAHSVESKKKVAKQTLNSKNGQAQSQSQSMTPDFTAKLSNQLASYQRKCAQKSSLMATGQSSHSKSGNKGGAHASNIGPTNGHTISNFNSVNKQLAAQHAGNVAGSTQYATNRKTEASYRQGQNNSTFH